MEPQDVRNLIMKALPEAEVEVEDLTGGGDHFRAEVFATQFIGLPLIEQHRLVMSAVQGAYDDGRLHALSIKTIANKEEK